jgi:hypothetical protein
MIKTKCILCIITLVRLQLLHKDLVATYLYQTDQKVLSLQMVQDLVPKLLTCLMVLLSAEQKLQLQEQNLILWMVAQVLEPRLLQQVMAL